MRHGRTSRAACGPRKRSRRPGSWCGSFRSCEAAARFDETIYQRCRGPEDWIAVGVARELPHAPPHNVQPNLVRIEHRPPACGREAISGEIDDVDIGGARRDLLFQDLRALVDQRVYEAVDDLRV